MAELVTHQVRQFEAPPAQATSQDRDERPLLIGQAIERPLKSEELHFYTIELKSGQVLQVNVQEKGVDLRVGFLRTADEQITTTSDFGFGYGRETFTTVIEKAGNYEVLVGARQQTLSGAYQMMATLKETATESDNKRIKAERLLAEGLEGRNQGTTEGLAEAIKKWGDSLGLWKELREEYWEGYTNNLLGIVSSALGDQPLALKFHNRALTLLRAGRDKHGEATALNNIGAVYDALDELQALKFYDEALSLYRQVGDKSAEAYALNNTAAAYFDLGDNRKALKFFDDALSLLRQLEEKSAQATALTGIGAVYSALGDPDQALRLYNEALPLRRLAKDISGEANTLNNIGAVHDALGDKELALKSFHDALALTRKAGNKRGEAQTLTNIGKVQTDLGDKEQALNFSTRRCPCAASSKTNVERLKRLPILVECFQIEVINRSL